MSFLLSNSYFLLSSVGCIVWLDCLRTQTRMPFVLPSLLLGGDRLYFKGFYELIRA